MVTNQIQLMSNVECLKVLYWDLRCSIFNDLYVAIKCSEVYHFADDTNILNFNSWVKSINKQISYDKKCP